MIFIERDSSLNIPNILTVIRMMMVPVVGFLIGYEQLIPAVIIYILACVTDVVDGRVARKYGYITDFGKLMDPVADKTLTLTTVIMLAVKQIIYPNVFILNWIVPIILITKEFLMIAGGIVLLRHKSIVQPANWYGKLSTVLFFGAFVILMTFNPYGINVPVLMLVGRIALGIALLFAFFAFFKYLILYINISKKK